jgi:erythromycin esterase-like protein
MQTESRLQISGKKMRQAAVNLAAYEEKCASLLQVISEKDKNFDEMQAKLASAQSELTEQAMVVQQANRDLISAQKQLQTQVEMQRGLERSLGATEA